MPQAFLRSSCPVAAGVLLTAAIGVGCNGVSGSVTAPDPTSVTSPATTGILWGMVIESSGGCIENATVQVVSGQRQGERQVQETPCNAWGYGGGFVFKDLTPGVSLTLRASAPGWTTQDKTFLPFTGTFMAVSLTLSPVP